LEFKTKSHNIRFFLENEIPRNVVCSWTLNTPTIIDNEEHFTAKLEQRMEAARRLADRGIKVAFHFHPMIFYEGWKEDYTDLALELMGRFKTSEVLFVSFGSLTLIKPAIQKIRESGITTKIIQTVLVPDPHGKMTYPDEIKIKLFKAIYDSFKPWRDEVYMYLCMEKASIWERTLGYVYRNNNEFEKDLGLKTMRRLSL
jgi:spore photoproduct lyase